MPNLSAAKTMVVASAIIEQAERRATHIRTGAASRIAHVETELSNWKLFARCMSNDGLIALAIDDAGPALSALANDLLLSC